MKTLINLILQGGAIYFSSGKIETLVSYLIDCVLSENVAYSGWGGAFYGVDSPYSQFNMLSSTFVGNRAYSSYITQSHGGALMITSTINLNISDCTFSNNSALPYLNLAPLTFRYCLLFLCRLTIGYILSESQLI